MPEGLRNLNKVILIGRLTQSPELKYTPKGAAVSRFNIAVNSKKRGKPDEPLFIDIVVWNKQAEFCAQYFKKGKGIYIEGELSMRKWKMEDNDMRSKIEVVADKISFLDSFSGAEESDQYSAQREHSDVKKSVDGFIAVDNNVVESDIPF